MRKQTLGWILILVLSNAWLGFLVWRSDSESSGRFSMKYPLLSKRLAVEDQNDFLLDFEPLRQEIKSYLNKIPIDHSFYVEYLPSGVSVRGHGDEKFRGASLMKIPLVVDLFRRAEEGHVDLDAPVVVTEQQINDAGGFGNVTHLRPGDRITLREAARLVLTLSDNTAAAVLMDRMGTIVQEGSVLNMLDLPITKESGNGGILISAMSYASIFKCLYLSCFLSPASSQEILEELSRSANRDRLVAGIPGDVKAANKIGAFNEEVQSDCAIVYEPNRPYLICLMLSTPDSVEVAKHFKTVSKMTYSYVHGIKRNF